MLNDDWNIVYKRLAIDFSVSELSRVAAASSMWLLTFRKLEIKWKSAFSASTTSEGWHEAPYCLTSPGRGSCAIMKFPWDPRSQHWPPGSPVPSGPPWYCPPLHSPSFLQKVNFFFFFGNLSPFHLLFWLLLLSRRQSWCCFRISEDAALWGIRMQSELPSPENRAEHQGGLLSRISWPHLTPNSSWLIGLLICWSLGFAGLLAFQS